MGPDIFVFKATRKSSWRQGISEGKVREVLMVSADWTEGGWG